MRDLQSYRSVSGNDDPDAKRQRHEALGSFVLQQVLLSQHGNVPTPVLDDNYFLHEDHEEEDHEEEDDDDVVVVEEEEDHVHVPAAIATIAGVNKTFNHAAYQAFPTELHQFLNRPFEALDAQFVAHVDYGDVFLQSSIIKFMLLFYGISVSAANVITLPDAMPQVNIDVTLYECYTPERMLSLYDPANEHLVKQKLWNVSVLGSFNTLSDIRAKGYTFAPPAQPTHWFFSLRQRRSITTFKFHISYFGDVNPNGHRLKGFEVLFTHVSFFVRQLTYSFFVSVLPFSITLPLTFTPLQRSVLWNMLRSAGSLSTLHTVVCLRVHVDNERRFTNEDALKLFFAASSSKGRIRTYLGPHDPFTLDLSLEPYFGSFCALRAEFIANDKNDDTIRPPETRYRVHAKMEDTKITAVVLHMKFTPYYRPQQQAIVARASRRGSHR